MFYGDSIAQYFYHKEQAKRERRRLRGKTGLVHLDISKDQIDKTMLKTDKVAVCGMCSKLHIEHPYIDDDMVEKRPYIHLLCDGTLVDSL